MVQLVSCSDGGCQLHSFSSDSQSVSPQGIADHPSSSSSAAPPALGPSPSQQVQVLLQGDAYRSDWLAHLHGPAPHGNLNALHSGSDAKSSRIPRRSKVFLIGSFSHTLPGSFCYCSQSEKLEHLTQESPSCHARGLLLESSAIHLSRGRALHCAEWTRHHLQSHLSCSKEEYCLSLKS